MSDYLDKADKFLTEAEQSQFGEKLTEIVGQYDAELGALVNAKPVLNQAFAGTSTTTHNPTIKNQEIWLSNDGTADLTLTVNGVTYTIKPFDAAFDEHVGDFTSFTVTTSVPYRARVRGR